MVIQEKAKKEEEKVDVVKEKPVAPQVSRTGKKGQQQQRLAYPLGKPPKKESMGYCPKSFLRAHPLSNVFIILFFDDRQKLQ